MLMFDQCLDFHLVRTSQISRPVASPTGYGRSIVEREARFPLEEWRSIRWTEVLACLSRRGATPRTST
eukprot:36473-Eustigmatos_ZCMA.PRE.1